MIKVWGRASSSNVQAVMWATAEMGLAVERIDAGFIYGVTDTPEFLAMNPNGTVPVVQDGDGPVMWETGAILRYLASRHCRDAFWPPDPDARAVVDKWAEWAKINVALKFTAPIFWRLVRTAPSRRDPGAIAEAVRALDVVLRIADRQLARHPYLAGPDFTLADIQMGHLLYRYHDIDIPRPDLPNLRAYYDRLRARPAYARHVMVSYEELRVTD